MNLNNLNCLNSLGGNGGGSSFSPSSVSGLVAWFKGDAGLYTSANTSVPVTTTGDLIRYWTDQSGNGHHLSSFSDAKRPTYTTGLQNGKPGVTFAGKCLIAANFTLNQPEHVFAVIRHTSYSSYNTFWDGSAQYTLWCAEHGTTPNITISALSSSSGLDNGYLPVDTTFRVFDGLYSGSNSFARVNNDPARKTTGNAGTNNAGGLVVGAFQDASFGFSGDILELLIYSNASMTDTDSTNIINYLNSKYVLF